VTAHLPDPLPPRPRPRRCSAEVARHLLAASGSVVSVTTHKLTEDVDGVPLGVRIESFKGMLYVTARMLGWTAAELGIES